jgi:hypothetical protein
MLSRHPPTADFLEAVWERTASMQVWSLCSRAKAPPFGSALDLGQHIKNFTLPDYGRFAR